MGIINITPDSFYSGSRKPAAEQAVEQAGKMLAEGATFLDIGGQSTRPDSQWLDAPTEWERVEPALKAILEQYPDALISIDTFHASVAAQAVAAGAVMVNDISGGQLDPGMLETVGRLGVPYVCMHMKGSPQTMQQLASYDNLVLEVMDYFIERMDACRKAGINDLVLDPGFGFSKTIDHNFQLLKDLSVLKQLGLPVLAGLSRKSTIYKTLGIGPEEALNGTTVLNTIALQQGADILRVHDVLPAMEAIKLTNKLAGTGFNT
ncbi:dihydropteroate synthase [Flavihumibacter rivuli]|uniref:dihydropteroate synthase n=1 Tax=Flavihumibacter rivuli TaxID=2838156 RepID=UPI001EFA89A7|nr:dihydropteroate synthase [Flavihumibacter rivuli]ULQ57634.1 dihydropteroate synthase [Flavihumibacter rivuli]